MSHSHVVLGLLLRAGPVPLERDVDRGGQMNDEVGVGDLPVEPSLALDQPPPQPPSVAPEAALAKLGAVRCAALR